MNLQILEKSFLPLLMATLFIVAFNWQFTHIYNYLIEHFKDVKLSILYAHLFIYSFLSLSLFMFTATLFNRLIFKSQLFIAFTSGMILIFYALSFSVFIDLFIYFIEYPLSSNAILGMVLFTVGTLAYVLYPLVLSIMKRDMPLSHSFIFFLFTAVYSALFINTYCYPIKEILTKF